MAVIDFIHQRLVQELMLQCVISDFTHLKFIEALKPWNKVKVIFSDTPETESCVTKIPLGTEN